jgi:RND family efflux transporter MFP subunit
MTQTQAEPLSNGVAVKRGRRYGWTVVKVVVALIVVAVLVYWWRFARVPVMGFAIKPGAVVAEVMGTGTLEARVSATISPRISGRIVEVLADQGDRVTAGQVLCRLDDSDLQKQVEMAEQTLAAARVAVERQTAEINRAHAVLDLAQIEFGRIEDLIEKANASTVEVDRTTGARHIAEADVQRAESAFFEAQAQVLVAEKTLAYHRALLADTVITAPFNGLLARRDRDPGDVVVPGASVMLILNTDEMWVRAWVDETEMSRLHADQPARVVFRSESERGYPAHVVRLGREVDRETREFVVDVRADALPENWAVGQRAEVYIETARATDVFTAPLHTIVWRDERSGVFVENDGHAIWRPVKLGIRGAQTVEVREGLDPGARVISPANLTAAALRDGQRVDVR